MLTVPVFSVVYLTNNSTNVIIDKPILLDAGLNAEMVSALYLGLVVVLNTDQSEYVPVVTDMAGTHVLVHDPREMPFPEDVGVYVAPGTNTGIGIRKVWLWFLEIPFLLAEVYTVKSCLSKMANVDKMHNEHNDIIKRNFTIPRYRK